MLANRPIDRHLLPIVFVAGDATGHAELECPALDKLIREKVGSFGLADIHVSENQGKALARSTERAFALDEDLRLRNELAVLIRKSRADKLTEIATEQVERQQRARLSPEESNSLDRRDLLAGHTGSLASRSADTVRQAILAAYCPPSPILPSVLLPCAQAAEPFPSALVHLDHGAQILFRRVP
jgi:hypothetical protein